MAFIDHASTFTVAGAAPVAAPWSEEQSTAVSFSALEWTVIALARRDPIGSLRAPGRLARAMGGLFGLGATSRLADPRLEALRRLAVQAWHHGFTLPMSEVKAFLQAGFTRDQAETLIASVSGRRLADRKRMRTPGAC